MDALLQDLRYGLRTLARSPGFTAAAVVALALGVGGSSAIFSVLEGVVLRPLAAPQPDQLVRLFEVLPGGPRSREVAGASAGRSRISYPTLDYLDLAKENGAFESVAGLQNARLSMTVGSGPEQLSAAKVTASFFATLKIYPALGRGFASETDRKGAPHEVVLTHQLWKREFSGDSHVLGQTTTLDGRTYTIVGVLAPDFRFPLLRNAEALVPFEWDENELKDRDMHYMGVFARLRPGITLKAAQADLDVLGPRIASRTAEHTGWSQRAVPLLDDLVGPVKPILQALLGAVLMVLLIACANVASLLLARGTARQREIAIRAALGSGRARLVRQLLTEALLLALAGGGLGVLLAAWGLDGLVALAPRSIPRLDEVRLSGPVLGFALTVSAASGLLAGLVPALHASRPDLVEALKNGAGGATLRGRARAALVVFEVALALVLVIGAGLMIRTLERLLNVRTGMGDPSRVLVAETVLPRDKYGKDDRIRAFQQQLYPRAAALPGVKSAAITTSVPLDNSFQATLGFEVEGAPPLPPGQGADAQVVWTTPGYLEALGIPLLRGRDLRAGDDDRAPQVVLVNQAFVRKYLDGGEVVGRRLKNLKEKHDFWEIVGVIGDVHTLSLDRSPEPLVVVPMAQWPQPFMRVLLRSSGRPMDLAPLLRTELQAIDKDQPLANARTLDRVIGESVGERRFQMMLLTVFGAVALVLASLGIYGVMAYSVVQRAREIGIRMALGAPATQVLRMVVGGGMRLAVAGVALGVTGALLVTRALQAALYQVSTTDPLTFLGVSALLLAVAAVASWAPARRAARVDPMLSLRAE
jgi:putative ABC transport system permease protein